MARHSWETDAAVAPRSGSGRVRRVLIGLLVIGLATFVAAYYVPLLRAHQALTRLSQESTSKAEVLDQKVKKLETDLAAATGERDKLSQAEKERASTSKDGKDRLAAIESDLNAGLKKYAGKGTVTVAATDAFVRVSIRSDLLFPGDKPELNLTGASALCDVARAAGAHRLDVVLGTQSLVAPVGESAWASASEAAGRVATYLEQRCGRRTALTIAVRDVPDGAAAHMVELRVAP
jgi:chemotaxis protein MotB